MYRLEPARQGRPRIPPVKRRFDVLQDHRHERPATRHAHGHGPGRSGLLAPFLLAAAIPLAGGWGIPSDLDPVLAGSWYASARPVLEHVPTVEAWYGTAAAGSGPAPGDDAPFAFEVAMGQGPGHQDDDGTAASETAVPGAREPEKATPGPAMEQAPPEGTGRPSQGPDRPGPRHPRPAHKARKAWACNRTEALYRKARLCRRYGKYDLAERLYRELLQANPGDPKALAGLAGLYMDRAAYRQAYPLLDELAGREPRDPEVLINLAVAEIALGMPDKALSHLDRAEALPHAPTFQVDFHRAVALGRLQRLEEALGWYQRCEELDPDQEDLLFNMAVAYDRLGRYEQAVTYYARYLAAAVSLPALERRDVEARIALLAAYVREQAGGPPGRRTHTQADRGVATQ